MMRARTVSGNARSAATEIIHGQRSNPRDELTCDERMTSHSARRAMPTSHLTASLGGVKRELLQCLAEIDTIHPR